MVNIKYNKTLLETAKSIKSELEKAELVVTIGCFRRSSSVLRVMKQRFYIDTINKGYFDLVYYPRSKNISLVINSIDLDNEVIYESLISKLNIDKLINKLMLFVVNYENEYDNDYI